MKKIVLILFVFALYSCEYIEIKENFAMTKGKIVSRHFHYRANAFYPEYSYIVNNIEYKGSYDSPKSNNFWKDFEGKDFPVAYSKINPDKSMLLISPDDFKQFDLPFPDSLNWVKDKLKF